MLHGLLDLSLWGYIIAALILTHITIASVTIFLHRHQAHRALELHPIVSHFFRFWLWLTTAMNTKEWVAVHRKHHAKCETREDPHSPQVLSLNKVLWQGAFLYHREAKVTDNLNTYGKGTPEDWVERVLYTRFNVLGVVLMLVIDIVLFGLAGILIWVTQMVWIPFWAAGVINGIGHDWGYRNHECPDASTNIVPWGVLIGGEELHNNHHAYSSSAKFSSKWWELDMGWMYIRLLERIGLARVKKVAPKLVIRPTKPMVDMETLCAVLTHRFQVTSRYGKEVLTPVLREELHKADAVTRRLLKGTRKLLVRDESLLDEVSKSVLERVLCGSQSLKTVYSHKQRLQEIWKGSNLGPETLLHTLQEWCRQAEATGIQVLRGFAFRLRGYVRQMAEIGP
ncbi:MAG: fatty acid desaturase [Beggiatoa sp.]|nr:fatty acid desaturase [Beggiatoa sp.]